MPPHQYRKLEQTLSRKYGSQAVARLVKKLIIIIKIIRHLLGSLRRTRKQRDLWLFGTFKRKNEIRTTANIFRFDWKVPPPKYSGMEIKKKSSYLKLYLAIWHQGPCEDGQWFVMKKTAQCETVRDGCLTDGHHVYWSPDETSVAKQCWKIGTRGPCENGKLIHLEQDKEELEVYCSHQFSEYHSGTSIASILRIHQVHANVSETVKSHGNFG